MIDSHFWGNARWPRLLLPARGSRAAAAGARGSPADHAFELTQESGRDGAELLQHGDAVELRPDVGHATVLEAVEVHALDPDRLAGGGNPHELLLLRTGQDPPGGDGVAAGDDVLQVLLQVGEDRLEERDLLLETSQRRLMVGSWIVVDQAWVAELVIVAWSATRKPSSKRVMISVRSGKAMTSSSG
jgi:hypothetical protein